MNFEFDILLPAFLAGLLVLATHIPFGMRVLQRGVIFADLAVAQIAGLGVIAAELLGLLEQPLLVQANPAGLALGLHQGTLTIARARLARPDPLAPAAVQEAVTILVVLVVLPVKQQEIYIPLVRR